MKSIKDSENSEILERKISTHKSFFLRLKIECEDMWCRCQQRMGGKENVPRWFGILINKKRKQIKISNRFVSAWYTHIRGRFRFVFWVVEG